LAQFQSGAGKYLIIAAPNNWLLNDLRDHRYAAVELPIDPRAEDIGGFTPLAHGAPRFYTSQGDRISADRRECSAPVTFEAAKNLPDMKWYAPPELLNDQ
jgi:hypothetical protein